MHGHHAWACWLLNTQSFPSYPRYYQLLEPWVHYIPVALDLSDLAKNVQWAIDHDDEAQAIVRRANEVMAALTRTQDMECYWYRFLLEYAQLNTATKPAAPAAT